MVARAHRHLLSMAQMRREPVIVNQLAAGSGAVPYRVLACPIKRADGRSMGVLALFRDRIGRAEFTHRDARLAELLARRVATVIEQQLRRADRAAIRARHSSSACAPSLTEPATAAQCLERAVRSTSNRMHVINDNYGMHIGDGVITQLGELIRAAPAAAARSPRASPATASPSCCRRRWTMRRRFAEALRDGAEN